MMIFDAILMYIDNLTLTRDFSFVHAAAEPDSLARQFVDFARSDF